jgi:hypothetical protein
VNDVRVHEPADNAAAAFNAMREELALLRAAMGKFAARQDELAARDYAPDLAQIIALQDQTVGSVRALTQCPGVALTPEVIAAQIEAAAVTARRDDHEALGEATRKLTESSQRMDAMVGRARTRQEQLLARMWSCVFGAGAVLVLLILAQLFGVHWR